jgi:hypothetical protein
MTVKRFAEHRFLSSDGAANAAVGIIAPSPVRQSCDRRGADHAQLFAFMMAVFR